MEIRHIHTSKPELVSVFGFGSFFRTDTPSDCDLLLVVKDDSSDLGKLHAELSSVFLILGKRISIDFDLTILTEKEHARKPLLEHKNLIPISQLA
ncbi:MAG: hypothetical protein PHS42_05295 [Sulfurimonas sp.]|nr:hypothetical protein [Sulfurimonas sp.]MDD3834874.1 hypothetical protein [Sulfurimonas sp.]